MSITGAIVDYYDNNATTLRGMIGTNRCWADYMPASIPNYPYMVVREIANTLHGQSKNYCTRIDRLAVQFDVYGLGKAEVDNYLDHVESAYLGTILTIDGYEQLGIPQLSLRLNILDKANDTTDVWHGVVELSYLCQAEL